MDFFDKKNTPRETERANGLDESKRAEDRRDIR